MTTYTLTVHTHDPDHPDQQRLLATHTADNPTAMIDTYLQAMVDHADAGWIRLHWTSNEEFVAVMVIDLSTLTPDQAAEAITGEGRDLAAAVYWREYHATRWEPSVHTPNPATH